LSLENEDIKDKIDYKKLDLIKTLAPLKKDYEELKSELQNLEETIQVSILKLQDSLKNKSLVKKEHDDIIAEIGKKKVNITNEMIQLKNNLDEILNNENIEWEKKMIKIEQESSSNLSILEDTIAKVK